MVVIESSLSFFSCEMERMSSKSIWIALSDLIQEIL